MIQLQLETIGGICNAACHFCLLQDRKYYANQGVPTGTMSMDLYRKIIDEAVGIPEISRLTLTGLSETLLDNQLEERIAYARQKQASSAAYASIWPIDIYTNGLALRPDRFDSLKAAGLTGLSVSLNAVRPEQHTAIMGIRAYEHICRNIDYAIITGGVHVEVKAVVNGDAFTTKDAEQFNSRWHPYAVCVHEGNWAGDNRTLRAFDPKEPCHRAIGQLYVTWEGRVGMCCFDPLAKANFGDLRTQSIKEVYNAQRYADFRQDHAEGRADAHAVCAKCTRI